MTCTPVRLASRAMLHRLWHVLSAPSKLEHAIKQHVMPTPCSPTTPLFFPSFEVPTKHQLEEPHCHSQCTKLHALPAGCWTSCTLVLAMKPRRIFRAGGGAFPGKLWL
jgi:hypothetical protein